MNEIKGKKVALVTSSLVGGGAEKLNLTLRDFLKRHGCQVDLIILSSKNIDYKTDQDNIYYLDHYYKKPLISFLDYPLKARALNNLITKIEIKNQSKHDFILASLSGTHKLFTRLKRENVIYWVHNTLSKELEKYTSKPKYEKKVKEYRQTYKDKNLIVTSTGVKQDLIQNFELEEKNIKVLYNFFDFKSIYKLGSLDNESIPYPVRSYILHIGRFSPQKRHDVLLDSYIKLGKNYPLVLLCKPNKKLIELIHEKGLENKVYISGFQQNPYKWIKNARLMVLTSDYEGFGNVIVEALALNTPVVSTRCPSGPEEILSGNYSQGLCKVGDSDDIARKMQLMLRSNLEFDQDELHKLYSVEVFTKKLFSAFKN